MSARRGGGAHWNDETQSWEQGEPQPRAPRTPAPPAGPPPSPPVFGAPPPEPPYVAPPWLGPGAGSGPYHEAETQGAYELPRDPAPPPPYAPPVDPGRRRQRAIVAAVATAVLAGGLAGGWLMWGRDDGSGGAAHASSSASVQGSDSGTPTDSATDTETGTATDTPTDTPGESPTDSGSPGTSTAAAVPDGFRLVADPLGWSVAVPATWTRTEERSSALYRSPDQRYLLQMFRLTEPGITPYEALRITSQNLASNRGYEQISLRRMAEVTTTDAAELVYAYNRTVQSDRIQGIARSFVAGNGVPYTVLVYGPDEDWPAQLGVLNKVLGTFTPD
ncbi:hypothetical protein [Streptomyces melanogenes]|uniref:hypothetical protein n=1 Tax=Streptomyces melanogenes TaxID=67326 RepID=UPI00167E70E6|nr:hypothetical protein [Streptomyces melanogenes]GGP72456.1 hypothetical protein GCM10010278_58320 [Streptomyces melanogenes]